MKSFKNSAFARFFTNFPKIMFANLLYTIPSTICFAIFGLIGYLTGFQNVIVWFLGIIPAYPLYAGLVMVIRKIAVEKENINVLDTFKTSVKDNWKTFLINGIITYLIVTLSVFAILYYYSMASVSAVYSALLTLYLFFSAMLMATMFYVPMMNITYDIKLLQVYKNSFILVFGKILRSVLTLLAVAVPTAVAFFAIMLTSNVWLLISGILVSLIYPLFYTYIVVSIISKPLQEAVGSFTKKDDRYVVLPKERDIEKEKKLMDENKDSEYVFVNGRMIKKDK